MLTLTHHQQSRVYLDLSGHSHGRTAALAARDDTLRPDKVDVSFQVGEEVPRDRRQIKLYQRPSSSRPGTINIKGQLSDRGLVHPLAAIASAPDEHGVTHYQGQVSNDQLQLRETTDAYGGHHLRGTVGDESVDFVVQTDRGRVDVRGSVGRESVSLQGFDYAGADRVPIPGIVCAIAFSAFFDRH